MAGLFIDVTFTDSVAADPALSKKLVEVCPVNIFKIGSDGRLATVQENLDECTLCDLCLQAAPKGTLQVIKLYES